MPHFSDSELPEDRRFLALETRFRNALEDMIFKFQFDGLSAEAAVDHVVERFTRLIQSAGGPVFDDRGYLPPMQSCTEAEVGRWFGGSAHRRGLLDRVRNWITLARAVKARRLLLDGSFVTKKQEPGDVDAVVLLPEDFRDQLRVGNPKAVELTDMFVARQPKELFAAEDEEDWWGWFEFFSRTREATGRRKGLIEVTL
jgi:hypothetical protein